jgi:hypothetical protein
MTQGSLNFTLQYKIGDEVQQCNVLVQVQDQTLDIPEIPVELTDDDMPSYMFRLTMKNVFSRLAMNNIPSVNEYDARIANG